MVVQGHCTREVVLNMSFNEYRRGDSSFYQIVTLADIIKYFDQVNLKMNGVEEVLVGCDWNYCCSGGVTFPGHLHTHHPSALYSHFFNVVCNSCV